MARPADCIFEGEEIVCGCDGKLYINSCQANLEGVGISNDGGCEMPPGTFKCGTQYCTHGTQYCQVLYSNNGPGGVSQPYTYGYACADLAAGCSAAPTCACVTRADCGDCSVSADGDLTARCLLPI